MSDDRYETPSLNRVKNAITITTIPVSTKGQVSNGIGSRLFVSPFGGHAVGQAGTLPIDTSAP